MPVYTCRMKKVLEVDIKANSQAQAMDWLMTHDHQDVINETTKFDIEYEEVITDELPDGAEYAIDIT